MPATIDRSKRGRVIYATKMPGIPPIRLDGIIKLDCGCSAFVGNRMDNGELYHFAGACKPPHKPLIKHYNQALMRSLEFPSAEPLVEVCQQLLTEAEGDMESPHPRPK